MMEKIKKVFNLELEDNLLHRVYILYDAVKDRAKQFNCYEYPDVTSSMSRVLMKKGYEMFYLIRVCRCSRDSDQNSCVR